MSTDKQHPVIGVLRPSPTIGLWRDLTTVTGIDTPAPQWDEFETPTIHGLARVTGARLDILAVAAVAPGRGDFRLFMAECQRAYRTIGVWEIDNANLYAALLRYGFRPVSEELGDTDFMTNAPMPNDGLRWDDPNTDD